MCVKEIRKLYSNGTSFKISSELSEFWIAAHTSLPNMTLSYWNFSHGSVLCWREFLDLDPSSVLWVGNKSRQMNNIVKSQLLILLSLANT